MRQVGIRIAHHPVLGPTETSESVTLSVDGISIDARSDDTVASALLAAEIQVFRTMPRTGEPRGGFCFVGRCADCLMTIDGQPNVMACQTTVRQGMRVERQIGLGTWSVDEQ